MQLLEPKRLHKLCKRSYPYVKKSFKTQHVRIPIDSTILAAIGHCFIANKKKSKNVDALVRGDARRDQKLESFLVALSRSAA